MSKEGWFGEIAPNVMKETPLSMSTASGDESTFQNAEIWSLRGLTKLLKSAVKLLEKVPDLFKASSMV